MRNLWVVLFVIVLFYGGSSYPFLEYREEESTIEHLKIDFYVDYYGGHDTRNYVIEKKGDTYIDDSGKIIASSSMEDFVASLTDLYAFEGFKSRFFMTDYYPSFRIYVTHSGREMVISSESNAHCNIPWKVEMNGQIFIQFNGKIPTALFALLIEIDEDYWSFMEKESRFNCLPLSIPEKYEQKEPSPFFPRSSSDIPSEEKHGYSHMEWTADISDCMMLFPLICDGNIIYPTRDRIVCLDRNTGKKRWDIYYDDEINGGRFFIQDDIQYLDGKLYVRLQKGLICLDSQTGALLWEITGNELIKSPVLQDGRLYMIIQVPKEELSDDSDLYRLLCVETQTGEIFWEYAFLKPGTGHLLQEIYIDSEYIYINSGEPALYCVNAQTGDVIWDYTGYQILEIEAFETSILLINSTQDIVTCLDKKTGMCKWEKSDLSRIYDVKIKTNDTILIPIISSSNNADLLLHVETGEILWEGYIWGHDRLDSFNGDILYFYPRTEKTLHALQLHTGEELWKCGFENEIKTVFVTQGGIVVADILPEEDTLHEEESEPSGISSLYFLDREGNMKWKYQYGPHNPCRRINVYAHDSLLFVTRDEGIIDAFDCNTGTVVWSIELRGSRVFELLFHNGNIYCSCDDGRIYCISEEAGDIRWIFNTENGFKLKTTLLSMCMELNGESLLVTVEEGPIFMISIE